MAIEAGLTARRIFNIACITLFMKWRICLAAEMTPREFWRYMPHSRETADES